MTGKPKKPLTQPEPGDPNYQKSCFQPGSLHTTDLPMQPSLAEQLGLKETMDFAAKLYTESMDSPATMVIIHCPICGWQQEVEENMWKFQSSPVGHGYTCGSRKCPSHTAMVFGPAPFDHKACILCDHVIVQKILGNKCGKSGSLCCNLKECPEEDRKKREAAQVKQLTIEAYGDGAISIAHYPFETHFNKQEVTEIRAYLNKDVISEPGAPRPQCEECIYQSQSADHDARIAAQATAGGYSKAPDDVRVECMKDGKPKIFRIIQSLRLAQPEPKEREPE